jgi:hypothetical protein
MQRSLRQFSRSYCDYQLDSPTTNVSLAQRTSLRCLPKYTVMILVVALWPLIAAAQAETVELPTTNKTSVLLLRNGQTFTGVIANSLDSTQAQYTLIDRLGNRLRFPKQQVEFVSDSIVEIYAYRRATQIRNNAPACLALAQWCMQSRLFDQAQQQINNAITITGRTATVTRLEIRLNLLRSPPVNQAIQSIGSAASTSIISADQVQQRIDRLPDGVVHRFIRSVQPLLLKSCALAGCHGPNPKSTFVLFRTSAKRAIPHRISLRNLYNTLTTLDLVQAENSLLLTAATSVHGAQNQPTLGIDTPQERSELVNWVRVVTKTPNHNFDSNPTKPIIPPGPIMYQRGNPQRTSKMITPDSDPSSSIPTPRNMPNDLQNWIQSRQPQPTLGIGLVLPIEMQEPTLGTMKIPPPKRVDLTPGVGGNFSLPSYLILRQKR